MEKFLTAVMITVGLVILHTVTPSATTDNLLSEIDFLSTVKSQDVLTTH